EPAMEVEVEVDRVPAPRPDLGRVAEVGRRRDEARLGEELPERNRAVAEVDPERAFLWQPALARPPRRASGRVPGRCLSGLEEPDDQRGRDREYEEGPLHHTGVAEITPSPTLTAGA